MLISISTAFVFVSLAFNAASTFGAPIPPRILEARRNDLLAARSPQPTPTPSAPQDIHQRGPQRLGRRFPQAFSADDLKARDLIARKSGDLKSRLESRTPDDEIDPRTIIIITTDDGNGMGMPVMPMGPMGDGEVSPKGKGRGRKGKGKGKGGCKCGKKGKKGNKKPCKKRPVDGTPKQGLPEGSPSMVVPMGSLNGTLPAVMPTEVLPTTENVKGSPETPSNSTTAPGPGDGTGDLSTNTTTSTTGKPTPPVDAGEQKRRLFARLQETRSARVRSSRSIRSLRNRSPS